MKLELTEDRVFVIMDDAQEKVGSIIVPDKHQERTRVGTIYGVGPEVKYHKVGDRVLVGYWGGIGLHLIGRELYGQRVDEYRFRIFRESEILAKIVEE